MRAVYGLILLLIHQSQISVHREPGAGRVHDGQARCSGRHGRPLPTPGARRLEVWLTAGVGPAVVPLNTGPGSFSGLIWMGSVTVPLDQRGPRLSLHARRGCWRRGLHRRAPENGSPNPARTESFLEVEHPIEARAKGSRATSLAATLWSSPAAVLDGQVSMSSPDYRSSASSAAARAAPSVVTGRYDTFLPISAATTSARCPGVMSA